jgi:hypothetical protein
MDNQKIQNDIEKMKTDYNRVSLSFAEKENLKASIFEKINSTSVASPYFSWSFYTKASSLAFATLILITSPVVAAAQKSLPGEFLYPVKTKVNESVVEIFIPESEKEDYHKELLTKRAFEVKTLSEEGALQEEQIKDVEEAIENSVAEVIEVDASENKSEEQIIQDHQDVVAVLEFTQNIIESKKTEEVELVIDDIKLSAKESLIEHVENIKNSENGSDDSVKEFIEDAKENILEIPEEDKKDFVKEIEKIELDEKTEAEEADAVIAQEQPEAGVMMMSAKVAEAPEVTEVSEREDALEKVLDLHEQISERKLELEIEKLEKSVNIGF